MGDPTPPLVPARPTDEAVVSQLASELHGIAPLPIASYCECLSIAKALLDVGCSSLMSLVVLPEDPINSVGDLQSYLQNLKYPLGKLQLCTMLKWIQQQRQAPASILDVGSKRAHPESPKRAPAATPAHLEPLLPMQTDADADADAHAHAAVSPPPADVFEAADVEAAGKFMEIVNCDYEDAVEYIRGAVSLDDAVARWFEWQPPPAIQAPTANVNVVLDTESTAALAEISDAVAIPSLNQDAVSDRDTEDSSCDYDSSGAEDFDLINLSVDKAKTSDFELTKHWGIDAGMCPTDNTLADESELALNVGDYVFVLQLEWGDDSLGRLRNRLEGRVIEFSDENPDIVHIKYCKGTRSPDGSSLWLNRRSFRVQHKTPARTSEVKRMNKLFLRCKMLKQIDTVVLNNSRLNDGAASGFHFEACRLIAKSNQPKGSKTEDAFYGKLEIKQGDVQRAKRVDLTQKNKFSNFLSYHISAAHSVVECAAKFWMDWAEKNDTVVSHDDPCIIINHLPPAFHTIHDHYSIRVTVEYPESYPSTTHHKMSVAFLGSMLSNAFVFEWFFKQSSVEPWRAFDDERLQINSVLETKMPEVRISSKRFLGNNVEFVRVVICDEHSLPLVDVEQLIWCDDIDRPMPSRGRFIEKRSKPSSSL